MRSLTIVLFLTIFLGCTDAVKEQHPTGKILMLPDLSIIDTRFPLTLTDLKLHDDKNTIHLNDVVETEIKRTIYSYYFNDCSGDSSETVFKVKDIYIGTVHLHDSLQTIFLILFKHIFDGQVNGKVLFYDNSAMSFANTTFNFNLHALYRFKNGELKPTNLKELFKINSPEIELVDYDNDGRNDYKFTRLYHNGTANAIETTVIRVSDNKIDTLEVEQKWIGPGTDNPTMSRRSLLPDSITKITGDFNGDGERDSVVVIPPYQDEHGHCEQCITKVAFTNNIDSITISYASNGAILFNAGDLDGNKSDELLLIPDWFSSCLGQQFIYTYKSGKWDTITSGQVYRCEPRNTIRKIKNGRFTMSEYIDGEDRVRIIQIK